jgi:hypothetical protein
MEGARARPGVVTVSGAHAPGRGQEEGGREGWAKVEEKGEEEWGRKEGRRVETGGAR